MTGDAYARLMAEAIPTRPAPGPHAAWSVAHRPAWTPEEQQAHVAELLAALDAHDADVRAHHLRVVPDAEEPAA